MKQMIHLAAAWVCPTSGQVRYCITGNRMIVGRLHSDGTCESLPHSETPPIGQMRAPEFELNTTELARGDSLFIATDGINTAQNAEGKTFGAQGLEDNLCDGLGDIPGHVLGEFESELTEFLTGGSSPDDITVVMLRRE